MARKNYVKCYLCSGKVKSNGIEIFGPRGLKLQIESILSQHFGFQLNETTESSYVVCRKCWKITDQFHKLYCRVQENNLADSTPSQCENQSEKGINPSTKVEIKYENEQIIQNDMDDSSSNAMPESSEPILKIEDLLDPTLETITDHYNARLPEKSLNNDQEVELTEDVPRVKRKYIKKFHRVNKSRPRTARTEKERADHQSRLLSEDTEIDNFIGICCDMCGRKESSFIGLRQHFRAEHRTTGYLKCCKKKFFRRSILLTHIKDHSYPDKYRCEPCNKSYTNSYCLRVHIKTHDPDFKSYHCADCPRRFESKTLLAKHIYKVHSNAPKLFECDICKKTFFTKGTVSGHILTVHTSHSLKFCELCAKIFKSQQQLKSHYAITHMGMEVPKAECNICGTWFNKRYLRRHMIRHEGLEATCNVCGKKSSNKLSLRIHMKNMHGGGKTYQCNFCEKKFKSGVILKEHIATHTGISLYKCPYCTMECNSNANMYKHKKLKHPNEWLEYCRKRLETRYKSNSFPV